MTARSISTSGSAPIARDRGGQPGPVSASTPAMRCSSAGPARGKPSARSVARSVRAAAISSVRATISARSGTTVSAASPNCPATRSAEEQGAPRQPQADRGEDERGVQKRKQKVFHASPDAAVGHPALPSVSIFRRGARIARRVRCQQARGPQPCRVMSFLRASAAMPGKTRSRSRPPPSPARRRTSPASHLDPPRWRQWPTTSGSCVPE